MAYICIDFDGTVVEHSYPVVGAEVPGAVDVIRELVAAGHKIIVFTMRSDEYLQDAVDWYHERGIGLYGVNTNPTQSSWTNSPKAYGHLYIDDAALGCPLVEREGGGRAYVDWVGVRKLLVEKGFCSGVRVGRGGGGQLPGLCEGGRQVFVILCFEMRMQRCGICQTAPGSGEFGMKLRAFLMRLSWSLRLSSLAPGMHLCRQMHENQPRDTAVRSAEKPGR